MTKCKKKCLRGMTKRRKNDIADLQELVAISYMHAPTHIAGPWNPLDALTKHSSRTRKTMARLLEWMEGKYSAM